MNRSVSSPKENIAENPVVVIQTAETQIKEIIVYAYYNNLTNQETEQRIALVIQTAVDGLPGSLKETAKSALAISAQRWHYRYNEAVKAANVALAKTIETTNIKGIKIDGKSYSLNVSVIAGMPANEQKLYIDRFRPYLTQVKSGQAIIQDYEKIIKARIKDLATDSAYFQRVDKNGNTYEPNLRNFAEMQVRYEANQKDVENMAKDGVKLVWTSSHPDASPRCAPYQGRLYSLDGSSGEINGIRYTPLSEATAGPRGDGNGIISGYNCRHRLIEYKSGSAAPKEYDKATIRKENYINNRQREYERQIRNAKIEEKLAINAGDRQAANAAKQTWQKLDERYKSFSISNGRAYYPWRTKATAEEIER